MPVSISGTNGVTFPDSSLQAAAASPYTLKNKIINGAMVVDQRNAGASVTASVTNALTYTLDRFYYFASVASKFTVQQNAGSVTPPVGFTNYLGITSSSAYSVLSVDTFIIGQRIEGFNTADLDFGTANAKTVTLSFWVRSSLTGTFGGALINSAANRNYLFSYTISVTNTWEYKTITVAGDTTGTWLTNNGTGIEVRFGLGSGATYSGTAGSWGASNLVQPTGSVSVVGTNGATFYITGVQLEQNTSATPFERRLYNQELANCQRYTYVGTDGNCFVAGAAPSSTNVYIKYVLPVPMRTIPTLSFVSSISISDQYVADFTAATPTVATAPSATSDISGRVQLSGFSGLTVGRWYGGAPSGTGKSIFSAEL